MEDLQNPSLPATRVDSLLRGLSIEVLLGRLGFGFRRAYHPIPVVPRSVRGIEHHWFVAGVDHAVAGTGRRQDRVVALDPRLITIDHDLPLASLDPEELVPVRMDLLTDLLAGFKRHQHELKVFGGIEDSAKILIGLCQFLDVFDKSLR